MATSLVNNKYRITRRIGGGSFGEIYMGIGPSGEKVSLLKCPLASPNHPVARRTFLYRIPFAEAVGHTPHQFPMIMLDFIPLLTFLFPYPNLFFYELGRRQVREAWHTVPAATT